MRQAAAEAFLKVKKPFERFLSPVRGRSGAHCRESGVHAAHHEINEIDNSGYSTRVEAETPMEAGGEGSG